MVSSLARFGSSNRVVDNATCATIIDSSAWGSSMPNLIVAATGTSYERRIYNTATGVFESIPSAGFVTGLHDASEMIAADLDGVGLQDLVTLGPNRTRVYGWTLDLVGTPAPLFSFESNGDVIDLAAVRTDVLGGDSPILTDNVALATKTGLHIYNHQCGIEFSVNDGVVSDAAITVLRAASGADPDTVAYARQASPTSGWLLTLKTGASEDQVGILQGQVPGSPGLVDLDVTGLRAGDIDGDHGLDLLVSQSTFRAAFVLDNHPVGSTPSFTLSAGPSSVFEYTDTADGAPVGAVTNAALGDLDNDGKADLIAPFSELHSLLIEESDQRKFITGGHPVLPVQTSGSVAFKEFGDVVTPSYSGERLRLHFLMTQSGISLTTYPQLQIQLWDLPSANGPITEQAVLNSLYTIPAATPGLSKEAFGVDLDLGVLHDSGWLGGREMYITYRFVDSTPNPGGGDPTINSSTRWTHVGFKIQDPANPTGLEYRSIWNDPHAIASTQDEFGDIGLGGNDVTGIVLGASVDVGRVSHLAGTPRPGPIQPELSSDIFFWDPASKGF